MTFRAKPVTSRQHKSMRETRDRRNFYLNLGFGIAVAVAVIILIAVVATTWYSEHLAPAATVNGQTITKDEFNERRAIESWRLNQQVKRVQTAEASGRITAAEADARIQAVSAAAGDNFDATILEHLIDRNIQAGLAAEQGISASAEEIQARLTRDATTPEERHAWIIAVQPEIDEGATEPTAAQKAAARAKADEALADITAGQKWEDIAAEVSGDASSTQGGDLGWITTEASEDQAFLDALFDAEEDKPTAVIETEDGRFVIGRVTEISPSTVDQAWEQKLADEGLKLEAYQAVLASEIVRDKLEDKVVADASQPGPQRKVSELLIEAPITEPTDTSIKVRHILYSPADDPGGASAIAADDPQWTEAELAARAAYDKIKADPTTFDEIARAESDEPTAQGETGSGGKLPYFDSESQIDDAFKTAIMNPDLKAGDLLEPFKSSFGWHVVQVMYRPTDLDRMNALRAEAENGADFADLIRDNSEGPEAGAGGELGFIARGQLDPRLTDAIFATPVGGFSQVVEIPDRGTYLYKVLAEESRTPDAKQLALLEQTAFANWYGEKKEGATITRDLLPDNPVLLQ